MHVLIRFNDHSLYDFCRVGSLHQHDQPSCPCWPPTGGSKPHVAASTTFFSACRIHGYLEIGECVTQWVLEMEPENAEGYVLLSFPPLSSLSVSLLNSRGRKEM